MVRHTTALEINLWLVLSKPVQARLQLFKPDQDQPFIDKTLDNHEFKTHQLGKHCFIGLAHVQLPEPMASNTFVEYELLLGDSAATLKDRLKDWCYHDQARARIPYKKQINNLLHGSCRKPHHPSHDGLLLVDQQLANSQDDIHQAPALLLMTGDQVYIDDVAGPMLFAVHQVIQALGLFNEQFDGALVGSSDDLVRTSGEFYKRETLLPQNEETEDLVKLFFKSAKKPIFTSVNAHNHLFALSEVIALYLLSWSPECWNFVDWQQQQHDLSPKMLARYNTELDILKTFAQGLTKTRRAMGHLPVYMIFDDHDVTDDWNLTRAWEEAAYQNPFSKRIIGNALIGYCLCQAWGNQPATFEPLLAEHASVFSSDGLHNQDQLIDALLEWDDWHYHLDTNPPIVVLDTRTHRWRSESNPNKPSGLMDWETLSDLNHRLIKKDAVILVSPSPVFGVKFIEAIQRLFTFFGQSLMVDAENWMAHPGSAEVMLNIFLHRKTPQHFLILSGDVHYSFVYDVSLRHYKNSPKIHQITASGIKNTFPEGILSWLDRLNRWLYGRKSPLNALTKRRKLKIRPRMPSGFRRRELVNQSGIGKLIISDDYAQVRTQLITVEGEIEFNAKPQPSVD